MLVFNHAVRCWRSRGRRRMRVWGSLGYVRPMTRNCAKVLPAIFAVVKLQVGVAELCARFWSVRARVMDGVVGRKLVAYRLRLPRLTTN